MSAEKDKPTRDRNADQGGASKTPRPADFALGEDAPSTRGSTTVQRLDPGPVKPPKPPGGGEAK